MSLHATTIYDTVDVNVHAPSQGPKQVQSTGLSAEMWGEDGFSFGDLLDIINPLQHIPVVSTLYRALTGDEISPGARLAGGGLFGGMPGLAFAAANQLIETDTGQDLGEHMIAAVTGDDLTDPELPVKAMVAQAPAQQPSPGASSGREIPLAPAAQSVHFFTSQGGPTGAPPRRFLCHPSESPRIPWAELAAKLPVAPSSRVKPSTKNRLQRQHPPPSRKS